MQIFVVGGAIRDTLLNRPVSDLDYVVVGSTPEEMLSLGYKQVGADFPVFLCPNGDEYALARTERKSGKGYHGFETDFDTSVTLEDDLLRRDLTMNSMAVSLDNWEQFTRTKDRTVIVDPHGGWYDIFNRVLRHTSEHFADDPVRLLRIARFHAKYGFNITRQTVALMESMVNNGEIDHLVPERVWQEINKAVATGQVNSFFWALNRCGALEVLIPNIRTALTSYGFAVRRASLRHKSKYITYMLLFGSLPNPTKTLYSLRAPNDITRIVNLFNKAQILIQTDMSGDKVLDFIKLCSNVNDIIWVMSIISDAMSMIGERECNKFDIVLKAERDIRFITYASLSTEQQTSLRGAEIAKAIDGLRLEVIAR